MSKIILLRDPGYLYDLNFIFCLKFNRPLYIGNTPKDKQEEAAQFYDQISELFADIPDDLYVFFHATDNGRAFLPTFYFNPYQEQFPTTYNFKFLLNELSDQNKLIRNVIRFYFYNLDEEAVEQCATSLNQIFSCIKKSDYSNEEKNRLYEFFVEPSSYIQTLQYELITKESMLSAYYKDHYQKIIDAFNETTYELLCEQLNDFIDLKFFDNIDQNLYTSYCLLNKYCVVQFFHNNCVTVLMGCEYVSVINDVKNAKPRADLYGLGTALGDENRVKILQFIDENQEITCKDLEKAFSFSGSTAYHHITIMTKSGLVQTRNEGKTLLYSINKKYVADIINILNKLLKKGN